MSAWQTLERVNTASFDPGDQILFERGGTWEGELAPCSRTLCSGTSTEHIRVDAYGSGPAPEIDGNGTHEAAVLLLNQSYWDISNLAVTNDPGSLTGSDLVGIEILCDSPDPARRACSDIYIGSNEVHDVRGRLCTGDCGNGWFTQFGRNAGIAVLANVDQYVASGGSGAPVENSNYFERVTIERNTVSATHRLGIFVGNWLDGQSDQFCATQEFDCLTSKHRFTNVVIQDNVVDHVAGDGILAMLTDGAMLQRNVVSNCGQSPLDPDEPTGASAGLWSAATIGTTIQYNEVFGEQPGTDRTAFDIDWGNVSPRIQYNYSHHNYGGMLLFFETNGQAGSTVTHIDDAIVRFNISYDDGGPDATVIVLCGARWSTGANPPAIVNNTVYQSQTNYASGAPNTTQLFGVCGTTNPTDCSAAPITGKAYISNNIFDLEGGATTLPRFASDTIFASNVLHAPLYPGGGPPCAFSDASISELAPQFAAVGSPVAGLKLASGSPALKNGAPSSYVGPLDFWGNAIAPASAPNRGAYSGPGL
jgi:hypothetical protein